jgi:hypothetical protein
MFQELKKRQSFSNLYAAISQNRNQLEEISHNCNQLEEILLSAIELTQQKCHNNHIRHVDNIKKSLFIKLGVAGNTHEGVR